MVLSYDVDGAVVIEVELSQLIVVIMLLFIFIHAHTIYNNEIIFYYPYKPKTTKDNDHDWMAGVCVMRMS